jgi:hypothetical protein
MENGPFIDGSPTINGDFNHGYVSHNQRVIISPRFLVNSHMWLMKSHHFVWSKPQNSRFPTFLFEGSDTPLMKSQFLPMISRFFDFFFYHNSTDKQKHSFFIKPLYGISHQHPIIYRNGIYYILFSTIYPINIPYPIDIPWNQHVCW